MTESEKLRALEDKLWKAADQLRANSSLAAAQYSIPVLGLIFLRYADVRFTQMEKKLEGKATGRREIGKADYQAQGVMYVQETARFSYLKALPEGSDIGQEGLPLCLRSNHQSCLRPSGHNESRQGAASGRPAGIRNWSH